MLNLIFFFVLFNFFISVRYLLKEKKRLEKKIPQNNGRLLY